MYKTYKKSDRTLSLDAGKWKLPCSKEAISHLERSMKSLEAGRATTPSFKLYGKTDVSVVETFLTQVQSKGYVLPDGLMDYEMSRLAKFGPQGGYAPWADLKDDFELYFSRPSNMIYVDADIMNELCKSYAELHVRLLSATETLKVLKEDKKIETRAAGWPDFSLKKTDAIAQERAVSFARSGAWKDGMGYTFSRFNKQKKRVFMPMPYSSMIKQATYFVPFLTEIQHDLKARESQSSYLFWADKIGFESCFKIASRVVTRELNDSKFERPMIVYVQRDFEKMDTTTSSDQYRKLFIPVLAAAHHLDSNNEDLCNSMLFTTEAPIMTPDGMRTGTHGTASGAEVTNGGETVCNHYYDRRSLKLLEALCNGSNIKFKCLISLGNGDDGLSLFVIDSENYDRFKDYLVQAFNQAAQECGFRVQADKWKIDTKFGLYCQNFLSYNDEKQTIDWMYPAVLILNSIMNPEHQYSPKDWDKDYRDLDIIVKLDNGAGLPYFKDLVDFVEKGLKYPLLGSSESETARILSKYERYRSFQTLGERFNRGDYDISNSETIKYVLSKRK